jgi:DNA adenine methylase
MQIKNPPFKYFGGKWQLASWILQYTPEHETYVEPFCGAASLLFHKEPSEIEVINDINGEVINFFRVLREFPDQLIDQILLTPYSREEYLESYETPVIEHPIEAARRFYVRVNQAFGGGYRANRVGWSRQIKNNRWSKLVDRWNKVEHLADIAERLKFVQIENDDAFKVIQTYDHEKAFFYIDPPYDHKARTSKKEYVSEFTEAEHILLSKLLHDLKGCVIISGYASELYLDLYSDWEVHTKETKTNGPFTTKVECIWVKGILKT